MKKQKAIIMDIDGVLADSEDLIQKYLRDVNVKDYKAFWNSIPFHNYFEWAKQMTKLYSSNEYKILMLTARQDIPVARKNTLEWLVTNDIHCDQLFMQPPRSEEVRDNVYKHGDVKIEQYNKYIKPYYDIEFMVDDNPSNVSIFRKEGLTVLQPNNWWDK